jgi:hypothetical protein
LTDGDGGLEEALRNALTADDSFLYARDLFSKPMDAEAELTAADLNYWNSPVPLIEAVPAKESGIALLESITALGGTVRTTPTRPKPERIPPKIAKPKADPAPKVSPQRRKRKPDLLDLPDEPARPATLIPAPRIPANAPVQLTLF